MTEIAKINVYGWNSYLKKCKIVIEIDWNCKIDIVNGKKMDRCIK